MLRPLLLIICGFTFVGWGESLRLDGHVLDPQGNPVAGASIHLLVGKEDLAQTKSGNHGQFEFDGLVAAIFTVRAEAPEFVAAAHTIALSKSQDSISSFRELLTERQSLVITAKTLEPSVDLRNSEVFDRTLFTRDDQVLQQLNAGIDAGQHEGGGKSLEIRRFGFNLDHGGVNGGLKVLVDDVAQNQRTQGHGQGYLGALKALSPELIGDVTIVNGPFSRGVSRPASDCSPSSKTKSASHAEAQRVGPRTLEPAGEK